MFEPRHLELPPSAITGCLVRVCWALLGGLALVISAVLSAWDDRTRILSVADAGFWSVVVLLVAVRYTRLPDAQDADSRPAIISGLRRYTLCVIAIAVVVWALAHVAAYSSE